MNVNATLRTVVPVTPSDTTSLADKYGEYPVCIIVTGTVGDIAVETLEGDTKTLPAAMFTLADRFPMGCRKVMETNTTATGIYVGYKVG